MNRKAYIQETVERVEKIIQALDSEDLTGAEKSKSEEGKKSARMGFIATSKDTLLNIVSIWTKTS